MRVDNNIQKKTEKTNNKDKPIVHNIFILDCSGSMYGGNSKDSKYTGALQGINEELKALENNKDVDFTHSLVEFGDSVVFTRWMENNNSPLSARGDLGCTALNDAIYQTITKVLEDKKANDKVLLKIMTDGGENASRIASYNKVKELIASAKDKNITVTFVGTDYDTKAAIKNYNLSVGNTAVHNNTVESIRSLTSMRVGATISYSKAVADGVDTVDNFYSKSINNEQ